MLQPGNIWCILNPYEMIAIAGQNKIETNGRRMWCYNKLPFVYAWSLGKFFFFVGKLSADIINFNRWNTKIVHDVRKAKFTVKQIENLILYGIKENI